MKILFIGGTGNISTDCAALLHSQRNEIFVVTRGRGSVPVEYGAIHADRKDPTAIRAALKDVRVDVALDFLGYELADVQLDYELFEGKVRQYIFLSSATVYAKPPRELPIREDAPLGNEWWDYAQKKLACERWLVGQWKDNGFPVTIVRPSHTYSKAWIPNPVSSGSYTFAARLEAGKPVFVPDDGENPWTLTATSDFAVGLAGLVGNDKAIGEAFHITSEEALTWNQIYGEVAAALGAKRPEIVKVPTEFICRVAPQLTGNLKGDKSHPGVFDNAKIKRFAPGFQCRKPFRVGVRESVEWLRAHPEQQNRKPALDRMIEEVIESWRRESA
jgi:nucleoside-diphosphate-sugar epimerase